MPSPESLLGPQPEELTDQNNPATIDPWLEFVQGDFAPDKPDSPPGKLANLKKPIAFIGRLLTGGPEFKLSDDVFVGKEAPVYDNPNHFFFDGSIDNPDIELVKQRSQPPKEGEYIKPAPKFFEQVTDTTRTNLISYVFNQRNPLGTDTENFETRELTEHDSLVALKKFLEAMVNFDSGTDTYQELAKSMLNSLTFIGKREYDEASKGIADIWAQRLRDNPALQLCVVTGKVVKGMIKSDAYLLDNILANFSDDQLEEFSGRIMVDPDDLSADPENVNIVLLDDWTISGSQLKLTAHEVIKDYPQYKDSLEIQLITATEDRIKKGIVIYNQGGQWSNDSLSIPTNAFFMANEASPGQAIHSGAHITGAHCAVDYDFNNELAVMAKEMSTTMPPLTNIDRPYRKKGVILDQYKRLRGIKPKEPTSKRRLPGLLPKKSVGLPFDKKPGNYI